MGAAALPIGITSMVAGQGMNILGSEMGARAAKKQRLRQLAEQEALQQRATAQTKEFLATYDPATDISNAQGDMAAAGTNAIPSPAGGAGFDISQGAGDAAAANAGQRAGGRLATIGRSAGMDVAGRRTNNRLADLGMKRNDIMSEAQQLAALYEGQINAAGSRGGGFRTMGNIASTVGPALAMYGMFQPAAGAGAGAGANPFMFAPSTPVGYP